MGQGQEGTRRNRVFGLSDAGLHILCSFCLGIWSIYHLLVHQIVIKLQLYSRPFRHYSAHAARVTTFVEFIFHVAAGRMEGGRRLVYVWGFDSTSKYRV